jgi:putative flavoprotein involved in K+ transport
VSTVVIGAGQAGLAVSHYLSRASVDHVILERGEVANSWRRERWDSLRLLTPNWQSSLPGRAYAGDNPDGYMSMPEIIEFISAYAGETRAPIHTGCEVTGVHPLEDGYRVDTSQGSWICKTVVMASGAFNSPVVPRCAEAVPPQLESLTPDRYRNPGQLAEGGVLVVGASATGLQLAEEIQDSGRQVYLAVGEHVRMPRRYRGRDILWWMDAAGILDERYDEVDDIRRARGVPSSQLVGTPSGKTLDLNTLAASGVALCGRLAGIHQGQAQFSGGLENVCKLADLKQQRLLERIDDWARGQGFDCTGTAAEYTEPTRLPSTPRLSLDLAGGEVRTILWATGFRPDYSWLHAPVLDRKGQLRHDGGVVAAPGLYAMGLPFMRRRKSSFIHGVSDDARDISAHLVDYLHGTHRRGMASVA